MKKFTRRLQNLMKGVAVAASTALSAQAATLTISCGSTAANIASCTKFAGEWAEKTGNSVKLYQAPASSSEALSLLRQQFAAKSSDIDVVSVDLVWIGTIKDHLIDLKPYSKGTETKHFPAIVANNTVDGKLLAMPWYAPIGVLYFRKDLLAKYGIPTPKTWSDLANAGKTVQDGERNSGNKDFLGYVFEAKAQEGLTCVALEWVYSYGGGQIVDSAGNITINNTKAAKAIDTAASWIGSISPIGVLNYSQEDARGVFQKGEALFMRNWPYAWALTQSADSPVKGKVGVMPLPAGPNGKSAATLGGWQLAVSKYSKNPDLAADLALYLASEKVQKYRAIETAHNPTIPELYKDKDILAANPFMGELFEMYSGAVVRPATAAGGKYPQVSNAFWDSVHDVLSKKSNGTEAVAKLEGKLKQIKRDKW